tara:strand:+ start:3492 stop:4862 length:1371 start_codon:yes stop_codon:yes gene_type:complete
MSATTIIQKPRYPQVPVGSDIIFTVKNNTVVAQQVRVKFIAEVHISSGLPPNVSNANDLIGYFKTTPNNEGVGIFDLSSVLENYVKADNIAWSGSKYKLNTLPTNQDLPIHLIDEYSRNLNAIRYLAIQFKVEYFNEGTQELVTLDSVNSESYKIINAYLKETDVLRFDGNDFGYWFKLFNPNHPDDKFLTNAPTTQYANIEDYGTFAFFSHDDLVDYINIKYYVGSSPVGQDTLIKFTNTGAYNTWTTDAEKQLLYFGIFPANLTGADLTVWMANYGDITSYEVQAYASGWVTQAYTIHVNCPDLKGYESVRLTWLNQWGAWDYYTFTKKSSRTISTKGSTYSQQRGTWNEGVFKLNGYKGGKKSFRINATENIKINTDFVDEATGVWFEELINSPEIYMLEGYQTDLSDSYLNNYVTPVRLTTSTYTKKTIANDRLMQYTFEIEKTNTLRTQSI